jgi:hypothetical protein
MDAVAASGDPRPEPSIVGATALQDPFQRAFSEYGGAAIEGRFEKRFSMV